MQSKSFEMPHNIKISKSKYPINFAYFVKDCYRFMIISSSHNCFIMTETKTTISFATFKHIIQNIEIFDSFPRINFIFLEG